MRRRLLTLWPRLLVLSALLGLGWLLWHLVLPQPRCHIPGLGPDGKFYYQNNYLSQDGRLLIVDSSGLETLQVWDTFTGKILWQPAWVRKPLPLWKRWTVVSRDGRFIVSCTENQCLTLDSASGREYPVELKKHDIVNVRLVGRHKFALQIDKETLVGEFATGRILQAYAPGKISLSPNEAYCLCQNNSGTVVDDLRSGQRILELNQVGESFAFSPGSRYLIHCHSSGALRLWDLKARQEIELTGLLPVWRRPPWPPDGNEPISPKKPAIPESPGYRPNIDYLLDHLISPDDRFVLLEKNNVLGLHELPGGQKKFSIHIPEEKGGLYTWCFSPDGICLAVLAGYKEVSMFEVPTGNKLWGNQLLRGDKFRDKYPEKFPYESSLVFTENSQALAVGKEIPDNYLFFCGDVPFSGDWEFYEASSGKPLWGARFWSNELNPPTKLVVVRNSTSNTKYKISGKGSCLEIFDAATGLSQGELYFEGNFFAGSGDGRTLVTKDYEGGFDVWDVPVRRSLHWVVGPPLALAALWLFLQWRRVRLRRRPMSPS